MELGARFLVQDHLNYDVLLGTSSMKKVNGVINFPKGRFEFQLSHSHKIVSLNLIMPPKRGRVLSQVQMMTLPESAGKEPRKDARYDSSEGIPELPQVAIAENLQRRRIKGIPEGIHPECWRRYTITQAGPPTYYYPGCAEDDSDSGGGESDAEGTETQESDPDEEDAGMPGLLPPDEGPPEPPQVTDDTVTSALAFSALTTERQAGEATLPSAPLMQEECAVRITFAESGDEQDSLGFSDCDESAEEEWHESALLSWMAEARAEETDLPTLAEVLDNFVALNIILPSAPWTNGRAEGPGHEETHRSGAYISNPDGEQVDSDDDVPDLVSYAEEEEDETGDTDSEVAPPTVARAPLAPPIRRGKLRFRSDMALMGTTAFTQLCYMDDTVSWLEQFQDPEENFPADTEPLCSPTRPFRNEPPDEPNRGIVLSSPQEVRRFFDEMVQQILLVEAKVEAGDAHERERTNDWGEDIFGFELPQVRKATDCPVVEAKPLPRLPPEEQWQAVLPQLQIAESLTPEQKKELLDVRKRHPHAFSKDPSDLGLVKGYTHRIDTGDIKPIREGPQNHSPFEKDESDRQMTPMEDYNVVRRSSSPYAAAVVLARKKGGKWRFCVDYRKINLATVPNRYPLPRINSIFDKLGRATYFTSLDAQAGYWQIRLHPEDVQKTAFLTHRGLFEFLRMPFGLTGAPGTYQMVMDQTLQEEISGPKPCVTEYLDDTLLYSDDFAEHLSALDTVLTKLEAIDLKLCPSKCHFGASETEHLGHLIRHNQLLPTPEKVRAIRDCYEPINPTEIESFLGMLGYNRIFVPRFAQLAKPLHDLTKIGVPFAWGPHQAVSLCEVARDVDFSEGME
ncbi:putative retrotransposon protein [Klebsormidium nitens]|uniref:Putative retrotransposon protein n=1 Tax=Klebsormidium nitens TaxID=105231 RepID=A0A1Y1IQQ8_KLENI|nr:putative retrotransposon protein [Klebsormidium nitens]|eukprot:GAQ93044.1 putative retrotransposon protein [Klebsormidium nitens]